MHYNPQCQVINFGFDWISLAKLPDLLFKHGTVYQWIKMSILLSEPG